MLQKIILSIVLVSLTSCCLIPNFLAPRSTKGIPYGADRVLVYDNADDMSQIIWGLAPEWKYEYHLRLERSYLISGEDRDVIHIEFSSQDILELCQARQLLVDVVEGLLERVNASPLAQALSPEPFTADNLEIYIDFQSFFGLYVDPFYIGWAAVIEGMSYFYAFDLKDGMLDTWHTVYEPYSQSKMFATYQRAAEEEYKKKHPMTRPSVLKEERYHPLVN